MEESGQDSCGQCHEKGRLMRRVIGGWIREIMQWQQKMKNSLSVALEEEVYHYSRQSKKASMHSFSANTKSELQGNRDQCY